MSALKLPEAVDRVETLGVADQRLLRSTLVDLVYKKRAVRVPKACEDFSALEAAGLVVRVDDPVGFAVAPDLCKVGRKLCTYLTRRNETDSYYDPDRGMVDYPKGAELCGVMDLPDPATWHAEFPDDEITALLDLHGVNRCRTWQPPRKGGAG